jgi:hypothetical protein
MLGQVVPRIFVRLSVTTAINAVDYHAVKLRLTAFAGITR